MMNPSDRHKSKDEREVRYEDVPNDIVDIYKKNMEDIFGEDACHVLKIRKYGGMKVL